MRDRVTLTAAEVEALRAAYSVASRLANEIDAAADIGGSLPGVANGIMWLRDYIRPDGQGGYVFLSLRAALAAARPREEQEGQP